MNIVRKGALPALILFAIFSTLLTPKSARGEMLSSIDIKTIKTVTYTPSYASPASSLGSGGASTLMTLTGVPALGLSPEIRDTNIPEAQVDTVTKKSLIRDLDLSINSSDVPVRIVIPSVGIDSPILGMGVNTLGELDVPSGKGNSVGWYKYGPTPGEQGSAVLDAHVFAAFAKLKYVDDGADVYIMTTTGKKLHFVVSTSQVYPLASLSPSALFGLNDAKRLNLVTCAGNLTPDRSTYDHRLVVYTTFKGVESA